MSASKSTTPLYPAKTIANLFNLTERRVQQLAKEGVLPKAERGKYDLVGCVRGYIKYLQDRAFVKDVGGDLHDHKSRLAKANADRAEMETAVMRQKLFSLDVAAEIIDKMIMDCKQQLLSVPSKAAPIVYGCKSATEAQDLLQKLIHDALHDLTTIEPARYLPGGAAIEVGAATEANG